MESEEDVGGMGAVGAAGRARESRRENRRGRQVLWMTTQGLVLQYVVKAVKSISGYCYIYVSRKKLEKIYIE